MLLLSMQLISRVFTPASDVYMLGTAMFELFVGTPWEGFTPLQVAVMKTVEHRSLQSFLPEHLPADLRALMAHCWAFNADERPTAEQAWS